MALVAHFPNEKIHKAAVFFSSRFIPWLQLKHPHRIWRRNELEIFTKSQLIVELICIGTRTGSRSGTVASSGQRILVTPSKLRPRSAMVGPTSGWSEVAGMRTIRPKAAAPLMQVIIDDEHSTLATRTGCVSLVAAGSAVGPVPENVQTVPLTLRTRRRMAVAHSVVRRFQPFVALARALASHKNIQHTFK